MTLQNINLVSLTSSQGFTILGLSPSYTPSLSNYGVIASSGAISGSISKAGDFNGDGYDDIVAIGSSRTIYVIYGSPNPINIDLSNLKQSQGISISVSSSYSYDLGFSISGVGDVNKDGYDDIIIGVPSANSYSGNSYIIYGGANLNNLNINNLNTFQGIIIYGDSSCSNSNNNYYGSYCRSQQRSGYLVAPAGDVNSDGYADVIIEAQYSGTNYVIYGGTKLTNINLASLDISQGFSIIGMSGYNNGWSISSAGDINNDGKADIMIGAYTNSPNLSPQAGVTYIIYGGTNSNIDLANVTASQGFSISGVHSTDWSGFSVAQAGDVNGDGISDIIIGAPLPPIYNNNFGTFDSIAYIIYGNSNLANINLASLTISQGFSIIGAHCGDRFGYSVSSAGDVNNDGFADIIIGAPMATVYTNRGSTESAGMSYVIYGGRDLTDINIANLNSTQGFSLAGNNVGDYSGFLVTSVGDINQDGYDDIFIGTSTGASYVVFGSNSPDHNHIPHVPASLPTSSPVENKHEAYKSSVTTMEVIFGSLALLGIGYFAYTKMKGLGIDGNALPIKIAGDAVNIVYSQLNVMGETELTNIQSTEL